MKVALLIEAEVTKRALMQTISLFGDFEFTENPYEAHVVIAESAKDLVPYYCKEREFVIFSIDPRNDQEAKNVHEYGVMEAVKIMAFPAMHAERLSTVALPGPVEVLNNRRVENPGAMRVLVIDDTPKHQRSALTLLADCDLTVAIGYDEAMECLSKNQYDVVLTDMEMPMSTKGALATFILGKLVPYGLLIANEAARRGAKQVAVVTDLNHHTDPFAAAFDHFSNHEYVINGAVVKYMHAPMTQLEGESVKDWKAALTRLTK